MLDTTSCAQILRGADKAGNKMEVPCSEARAQRRPLWWETSRQKDGLKFRSEIQSSVKFVFGQNLKFIFKTKLDRTVLSEIHVWTELFSTFNSFLMCLAFSITGVC